MKRFFCAVTAAVLLLMLCSPALAVVSQSDEYYVADYAGVLSESTEQTIIQSNYALESDCRGAQLVVVTVEYLDGLYSDEYANQLFNDWGVGDADENNGMLLLLATRENKAWLTQGSGLATSLKEADINRLFDKYFWRDFDDGEYDKAVNALFAQLVKWYEDYYDTSVGTGSAQTIAPEPGYASGESGGGGISFMVILLLIIVVVIFFAAANSGRRHSAGARGRSKNNIWILPGLFGSSRSRGRTNGYNSFMNGFTGGINSGINSGIKRGSSRRSSGSFGGFGGSSGRTSGGFGGGSRGGMGRGGGGRSSGGGGGRR